MIDDFGSEKLTLQRRAGLLPQLFQAVFQSELDYTEIKVPILNALIRRPQTSDDVVIQKF